jgi:hypothetical protein
VQDGDRLLAALFAELPPKRVAEQVVVPEPDPLVAQRHQKEVGAQQRAQPLLARRGRVGPVEKRVEQWPTETVRNRGQ